MVVLWFGRIKSFHEFFPFVLETSKCPILLAVYSPHAFCYMHAPPLNHVLGQVPTSQVGASQTFPHSCSLDHPIGTQNNCPNARRIITIFCTNRIGAKWSHHDKTLGTLC